MEMWSEQDDKGVRGHFWGDEHVHYLDYGKVMEAHVKFYRL